MIEFVTSSAMNFTWPSVTPTSPMATAAPGSPAAGSAAGVGGGAGGAGEGARRAGGGGPGLRRGRRGGGRRSRPRGGRGRGWGRRAGCRRADAAAREELVQDAGELRRVRELDRDDRQLLLRDLHVHEPADVEQPPPVRRR